MLQKMAEVLQKMMAPAERPIVSLLEILGHLRAHSPQAR